MGRKSGKISLTRNNFEKMVNTYYDMWYNNQISFAVEKSEQDLILQEFIENYSYSQLKASLEFKKLLTSRLKYWNSILHYV